MGQNIIKSTKSQIYSVLYIYSNIDFDNMIDINNILYFV